MKRFFSLVAVTGLALLIPALLFSCAPVNLYTINMRYTSPETPPTRTAGANSPPITIARFIDSRKVEDTLIIGTVVLPDGDTIPVLPKYSKPVDAVTDGIRKCLSAEGYSLSREIPAWNLESDSIEKSWGTALIGGSIDRLEVVCHKEGIKKTYRTDVKLTIVFADVHNARIVRTMEAAATSSLVHVRFSEEILEEQINKAFANAIEQICGNGKTMSEFLGHLAKEGE